MSIEQLVNENECHSLMYRHTKESYFIYTFIIKVEEKRKISETHTTRRLSVEAALKRRKRWLKKRWIFNKKTHLGAVCSGNRKVFFFFILWSLALGTFRLFARHKCLTRLTFGRPRAGVTCCNVTGTAVVSYCSREEWSRHFKLESSLNAHHTASAHHAMQLLQPNSNGSAQSWESTASTVQFPLSII